MLEFQPYFYGLLLDYYQYAWRERAMSYVNIIKIDLNIKTYFKSSGQINYEAIIWIDHPAQRFSLA
jgi:hypothetical protein